MTIPKQAGVMTSAQVSDDILKHVKRRMGDPRDVWGLPWGLTGLDKLTGGIQDIEMTVMMARPGVGKTSIMTVIAMNVARYFQERGNGKRVRLVLCESSARVFQMRVICAASGVNMQDMQKGNLTNDQYRRIVAIGDQVGALPIDYLDSPGSIGHIANFIEKDGLTGWFGVDYLQIVPGDAKASGYDNATNISGAFRRLAKEVAPCLVLSQMNRESEKREDKRPQLSDLRASGAIEQDAANVLGLYRDDVYTKLPEHEKSRPKPAELLVLKQRNGPAPATIELVWHPTAMQFTDISELYDDLTPKAV